MLHAEHLVGQWGAWIKCGKSGADIFQVSIDHQLRIVSDFKIILNPETLPINRLPYVVIHILVDTVQYYVATCLT